MNNIVNDEKNVVRLSGDIVFDNVSFEYPDGTLALRNISFRARPRTLTAIVGKSGSGKTTLSNLLCKFYEPLRGKILIDQISISEMPTSTLRANIGIMFQDPYVLERSFEDNVKFGSETKSWSEIENAMRLASIYEVYKKNGSRMHPPGTDEIAPPLSGGERQRLSLARILLKNPPIIILDEPTSSIDSITEKEIQEALENTLKDKTAIIIAHRLSTIKNADQIIVMNEGSIVETGTFEQLIKKGTYFSKLLKYQIMMNKSEKALLNDNII
jgi:ATP-binding cassette subfamily B protein